MTATARMGQAKARNPEFQLVPRGYTRAICCCVCRCTSRELDRPWSSRDSNAGAGLTAGCLTLCAPTLVASCLFVLVLCKRSGHDWHLCSGWLLLCSVCQALTKRGPRHHCGLTAHGPLRACPWPGVRVAPAFRLCQPVPNQAPSCPEWLALRSFPAAKPWGQVTPGHTAHVCVCVL